MEAKKSDLWSSPEAAAQGSMARTWGNAKELPRTPLEAPSPRFQQNPIPQSTQILIIFILNSKNLNFQPTKNPSFSKISQTHFKIHSQETNQWEPTKELIKKMWSFPTEAPTNDIKMKENESGLNL